MLSLVVNMIFRFVDSISVQKLAWICLVVVALTGTVVPTVFTLNQAGGIQQWQGVLPFGQVDSLYYYARIHEVFDGYPLVGNPYYYEHRDALSPAFFLPDLISAIPASIGLPFDIATVVNMFVWSLVFVLLTFTLLQLLNLPIVWALLGTILTYTMAFAYVIRPTILQLIYPIFLTFLILLIKFLYAPLERRRFIQLALVTTLAFYSYTLLAYIIAIICGLVAVWYLFNRQFKEVMILVHAGVLTALLIIPFVYVSILQLGNPYYLETFARIGLLFTHLPAAEVYYYGRWIGIGLAGLSLLWFFFPKKEEGGTERKLFWFVTGAGLSGGFVLNIITGVDLSLTIHSGRFFFIWLTMMLSVLIYEWYMSRITTASDVATKRVRLWVVKSITAVFISVLIICVMRNTPPGPSFFGKTKNDHLADKQEYAQPLRWLEKNVQEQSVIWANETISAHVPLMTKHYVLFHRDGGLHFLPNTEQVERYLLAQSADNVTIEKLKNDVVTYAGHGLNLRSFYQNQELKYCNALARFGINLKCPPPTTTINLMGDEYFKDLELLSRDIVAHQEQFLQKYHVGYRIIDRKNDGPEDFSSSTVVYDNGRFVIVSFPLPVL